MAPLDCSAAGVKQRVPAIRMSVALIAGSFGQRAMQII
jgi:hypothetical protein